ncbi:hypothetical protein [Azospirillum argentinense]|uniref:hypothetical protein n=1 Tax=Azospirillum argentinense TaxID=2970906 RepID=UPI0011AEE7A8|nr:hypothetical protein [Azospirillum argentinense]
MIMVQNDSIQRLVTAAALAFEKRLAAAAQLSEARKYATVRHGLRMFSLFAREIECVATAASLNCSYPSFSIERESGFGRLVERLQGRSRAV